MRKLTISLCIITILLMAVFVYLDFSKNKAELKSPKISETKTIDINQWFPKVLGAENDTLQITAKATLFVNSKDGQILYAKNIHQRLPIASLAKVMTALIALEQRGLDEKLEVSVRAAEMEPDKMLLIPLEKLTVRELLYGIFLISANDAAEVLAEKAFGNREQFINLMNKKAQDLGMKESLFVNPTGLDEDSGSSYSTVFDMAILAKYAIRKYPVLVEISQTPYIKWEATQDRQDYEMYSGINLLTTYPGVVGFKTGYTPEAGLTLITLARKEDHEVLGILLGSENRREEARELLDYSFGKLGI